MKTIYEMVKDEPGFKRFCARKSTAKTAKPKRFRVPIPKPKGINSVLRENEYTTGRLVRLTYKKETGDYKTVAEEKAYLFKHAGEFSSVLVTYPEADNVETISQGVADFFETCSGVKPKEESEAA